MVYTDPDEVPWSAYLALAGVMAVIVGALLPWYAALGESTTGLQHEDGYITAGVAIAALAFGVTFEWDLIAPIGAALAGAVTAIVGYDAWSQVNDLGTHDPKAGLWLTLIGGVLLLVAAGWGLLEGRVIATDAGGVRGDGST